MYSKPNNQRVQGWKKIKISNKIKEINIVAKQLQPKKKDFDKATT